MVEQLLFNDKDGETISVPLSELTEWCKEHYPQEALKASSEADLISIIIRHHNRVFRCGPA